MVDSIGSDVLDNGNIVMLLNIFKFVFNNQVEGCLFCIQVFIVSGVWVKIVGIKKVRIKVWGVGGGGKGMDIVGMGVLSGVGGVYVEGLYDVSSIIGVNIVIGVGGVVVVVGNFGNGGDGGDIIIVDFGIFVGGGKGGNLMGNFVGGIFGVFFVGIIFLVVG